MLISKKQNIMELAEKYYEEHPEVYEDVLTSEEDTKNKKRKQMRLKQ